jgi:hypothetical protein
MTPNQAHAAAPADARTDADPARPFHAHASRDSSVVATPSCPLLEPSARRTPARRPRGPERPTRQPPSVASAASIDSLPGGLPLVRPVRPTAHGTRPIASSPSLRVEHGGGHLEVRRRRRAGQPPMIGPSSPLMSPPLGPSIAFIEWFQLLCIDTQPGSRNMAGE